MPIMKLIPIILLLFSSSFSWCNIVVSFESRSIVVRDLVDFSYTDKIEIFKTGVNKDYFQIGLREGEILENLEVFQIMNDKKKKYKISNLLSESTIDNSSFFSGQKINYFPIVDEGKYEITYTVKSKETIFISEFYKNGMYNAVKSITSIDLPIDLQISTSQGDVLTGLVNLSQKDFIDSLKSIKVLVHPIGTNPEDYFSNWFNVKVDKLSKIEEVNVPKELLELKNGSRELLAQAIFDFVKNKITYVDIENGINAIVPRDCAFVQNKGRGDCKDMANLLFAYYKYFDFEAYLAISKTSIRKEKFDFPSLSEANHMICVLYLEASPIFLDATEKECEFRDPSLQIFNTEAFLIGKKPYFIDVLGIPFNKSQADVLLKLEFNNLNQWAAKLSVSTLGKSNTILKSLKGNNKFTENLPNLARLLVNLNWNLVNSSESDSTSQMNFTSPISKSNILNVDKSCYIDLATKLDLNMVSYLFYGDTIPTFASATSLMIQFPGKIKTSVIGFESDHFNLYKIEGDSDSIMIEFKYNPDQLKTSDWLKIKEHFNSILNKPIEIYYERI